MATMSFDEDALRLQIPYYLTADPARKVLLKDLDALSKGATAGYFISPISDRFQADLLQGDGWRGLQVYHFASGTIKPVRGIVLSNSCDVAPENARALPPKIIFAPIVKLSNIRARFDAAGLKNEQIEAKLKSIRSQSVTSMFYLPAENPLDEEHVALLDDLHSVPMEIHRTSSCKLFTLSMAGFYLFVFKLSIHFCRLHEGIDRTQPRQ